MMAAIKCPICKNRISCEIMGIGDSAIQNCGMLYYTDDPPRRSNGDVIRAMTDEELAEHHKNRGCPPNKRCPVGTELRDIRINDVCTKCWLDWLRKEAPKED